MLLTKVRMEMSHRGPPQCLILFEYKTQTRGDMPSPSRSSYVFSMNTGTADKKSAHLGKSHTFSQPIEMRLRYHIVT